MTKFIVNNRTDALKTDINLFFNKLTNFLLSFADALLKFQIHMSVRILTIKISQWACMKFCSYRENGDSTKKCLLHVWSFACLAQRLFLSAHINSESIFFLYYSEHYGNKILVKIIRILYSILSVQKPCQGNETTQFETFTCKLIY